MKRLFAVLLCAVMLLSLAACGDNANDKTPVTEPAATEATEATTEATTTEATTVPTEATTVTTTEPIILEMVVEEVISDGEYNLEKLSMEGATAYGSTPWQNGSDTCDKAIDGDLTTFFDGVEDGWLEIDLGGIASFDCIGYCPRSNFPDRMVDGKFYVSVDGEEWTEVYTVETSPAANKMSYAVLDQTYDCRYIRYDIPSGQMANGENYCANIAEVAIYRTFVPEAVYVADMFTPVPVTAENFGRGQVSNNLIEATDAALTWAEGNGVTIVGATLVSFKLPEGVVLGDTICVHIKGESAGNFRTWLIDDAEVTSSEQHNMENDYGYVSGPFDKIIEYTVQYVDNDITDDTATQFAFKASSWNTTLDGLTVSEVGVYKGTLDEYRAATAGAVPAENAEGEEAPAEGEEAPAEGEAE